jgi:exodeoxyribonuclease VII small subunit
MSSSQRAVSELEIKEGVEEVESIIERLEQGDVSLDEAVELRERGEEILSHLQSETEVSDGDVNRVTE